MKILNNFHVLKVNYVGATNEKGGYVKIYSERFKSGINIPFNNDLKNAQETAQSFLEQNGFNIIGKAEGNANYDYLITDTFLPVKPEKFKITFTGRIKGAIGQMSEFTKTVMAHGERAALLKLYDNFDHVLKPRINGVLINR